MKPISSLLKQLSPLNYKLCTHLALFSYYFNREESIILPAYLNSLYQQRLIRREGISDFQYLIKQLMQLGLAEEEVNTSIIRLSPLLTHHLSGVLRPKNRKKLIKAYVDFNSGYANYINDVYLNSGDEALYEEGLKVVLFELHNFMQTIHFAIEVKEDFIHLFHLVDIVLDIEEEHEKRLFLANLYLKKLDKLRRISIDFKIERAVLISIKGDIYYRLGALQQAIESYQIALKDFILYKAKESEVMVLINLGNVYSDLNQIERGNEYYEKGISLLKTTLDKQEENTLVKSEVTLIQSYINLGQNYYILRNFDQASDYQRKAIALAEQIGDEYNKAIAFHRLGLVEVKKKHFTTAQEYYLEAAKIYDIYHDTFSIGEINQNLGYIYSEIGKAEKAIEAYKQALEVFIFYEDDVKQAEMYNNLASIAFEGDALKEALSYYKRALNIMVDRENPLLKGMIYQGMGSVYMSDELYMDSQECYQQALSQFKSIEHEDGIADIYLNYSSLYLRLNEYGKVREYASLALPMVEQSAMFYEKGQLLLNIATSYHEEENYEAAIQYYQKAAPIFEEYDLDYANFVYQQMGMIFYLKKEYLLAEENYLKALTFAKEMRDETIQKYIYQSLVKIMNDLGDKEKASYYEQASNLKPE